MADEQKSKYDELREQVQQESQLDIETAKALALIDIAESLSNLSYLLPQEIQRAISQGMWEGRPGRG